MSQVMVDWMTTAGITQGHLRTILLLIGAESEKVLWFYSQLVAFYTLAFRYAIGEFDLTMPVAIDIQRGLVRPATTASTPPPMTLCLPTMITLSPLVVQYTLDIQEHIFHCVREHRAEMEGWFAYLQRELKELARACQQGTG